VSDFALTLAKKNSTSGTFILTTSDGEESGTYTTDGKVFKFSKSLTFLKVAGSETTIDVTTNELTIVKYEEGGELWLGTPVKYSTSGKASEYLCIKLKQKSTGAAAENGTRLVVDNSKILYGDLEGNGNLRIEIFNAYGSGTKSDSPIEISKIKYKESIKVTFTVSGLGTLSTPVTAFLMNSLGDVWNAGAASGIDATITGDGTYTVATTGKGSGADSDTFVFNVDMVGMANATSTDLTVGDSGVCPNVSIKIDSIWLDRTDE
jgi:hypothetical protein